MCSWDCVFRAGFYSLTSRALLELGPYLFQAYNTPADEDDEHEDDGSSNNGIVERIKTCHACREIVTIVCPPVFPSSPPQPNIHARASAVLINTANSASIPPALRASSVPTAPTNAHIARKSGMADYPLAKRQTGAREGPEGIGSLTLAPPRVRELAVFHSQHQRGGSPGV